MMRALYVLQLVVLTTLPAKGQAQGPLAELERNRALWDSHGFTHYSFIVTMTCFCLLPEDVRIIVADSEIYDMIDPVTAESATLRNGDPFSPRHANAYQTIEELFTLIEAEIAARGDALTGKPGWIPGISAVLYDEQLGYPTAFSIDHGLHIDSDGVRTRTEDSRTAYRLRGLIAVPPER